MPVDNRLRWLLTLLAVVLALRFAVMPWLQWVDEHRAALEVLTNRLERSDSLLANKTLILESLAAKERFVSELAAAFPVGAQPGDYRIKTQQSISESVVSAGVALQSFEWVRESSVDQVGRQYLRARFTLAGAPRALASFHAKLETEYANLVVREISFGASGLPVTDPDVGGQSLTLVGDFFILASGPEGE